ncbi:unnamed protein product [Hydatigera taeniaeformis]|uniref:WD_REPEATS_REGION domain-containing protein n=1 Tax=Hydatigena taeniaeformis TaxID=6205 RepID=A0A0R3X3U5_HYDTA|nr:unnamed protein product [Hydatigera taeniaeformis]
MPLVNQSPFAIDICPKAENRRYGYDFHENWCAHMAHLALWNVAKSRIDPDKPDYIFDTNCCMNTVAFCDEDAPLVAGGTVSGELVIWSLSTENGSRVATCGCVEGGHQDSITGIFWLSRKSLNAYASNLTMEYHLVTVGADGRIICWILQRDRAAVFTLKSVKIYQVTGKDQSSRLQQDVYTCNNCDESLGSDGANIPPPQIYNILDRTRLYTLATEEGQIFTLHFLRSPPSRSYQHRSLLAYGSARGTVAIYDLCCNGDVSGDTTESEDFTPIKRCVLQCHKEMCTANPVICMASTDSV